MEVNFRLRFLFFSLKILSTRQHRKFQRSISKPKEAQAQTLNQILKLSRRSELPSSPTDYNDYADNSSWTIETPKMFEFTSGSTGVRKKIPYTKSLLSSFQNMFLIWLNDIFTNSLFRSGKTFISLSPQLETMGLSSDLQYLASWLQKLISPYLVVKPQDFIAKDGKVFMSTMARNIALCSDLEIISIWSPSYLFVLLETMSKEKSELMPLLSPERQKHLQSEDWKNFWPQLQFISCWGDAWAFAGFEKIKKIFPEVQVQKKGLLSTEAPMTIPWIASGGHLPLWTEVYFEYINRNNKIRSLTEIQAGEEGELLISTKGGLLRYRICDRIKCEKIYQSSPVISFLGRGSESCDLVGEKLTAELVRKVFADLKEEFILFADRNNRRYVFVCAALLSEVDTESLLQKIYHYKLARELGQLFTVRFVHNPRWIEDYHRYYQSRGFKIGDIKLRSLSADQDLLNHLIHSIPPRPSAESSPV